LLLFDYCYQMFRVLSPENAIKSSQRLKAFMLMNNARPIAFQLFAFVIYLYGLIVDILLLLLIYC